MPDEVLRIHDDFYIRASSSRVDDRRRVLKQGDTFALFDRFGDIEALGTGALGLYHEDTRFLSRLVLRLGGRRPLLLSSTVKDDNAILAVDLMNADLQRPDATPIPRGSVHVFRTRVLWEATCHERLRVHNYGLTAVGLFLTIDLDADFADIFELRGLPRARQGVRLPAVVTPDTLSLSYRGLDDRVRTTRIGFDPPPASLAEAQVCYELQLEPRGEATCRLAIACLQEDGSGAGGTAAAALSSGPAAPAPRASVAVSPRPAAVLRPGPAMARALWYEDAARRATDALALARGEEPEIFTSNEQFNDWVNRSQSDLLMMRTETEQGPYPYAGVPWFSTVFGRDGIVTALQTLWMNPALARGVLAYLAATQADAEDAERDAEPGKVLHERRAGEMAATGEVPFARYYGSVDATPLFVVLAGAFLERTGDVEFARSLWPHVERALAWMERYADRDGDGFIEYARRSPHGLVHQGWKDSSDSVFHADGTLAEGPIAACEVQGYAYSARLAGAALAEALGRYARAEELRGAAAHLRQRFEQAFWCEELSTYALALDGGKRPCQVRTSNPGHCLMSGIADRERARRVAASLTDSESFSGWGIRTVAASEARYNPMSYHNGSVWPHDCSLAAAGFARYGLTGEVVRVLTGLFDASLFFELHRLPELFCGFPRRAGESPTLYPVSCAPQSWASGAVFLLLRACLGLHVDGRGRRVVFTNPLLPDFLDEVQIRGLRVADATVDVSVTRHGRDAGVNVLRREGQVSVVAVK